MSAEWLSEYRSIIATLSSLLVIAGFLIIAARSGKSRSSLVKAGDRLPSETLLVDNVSRVQEPATTATDVVALLPPSDAETTKAHLGMRPILFLMAFDVAEDLDQERQRADQLHDDIVAILSRSSDLAVIGRRSREWTSHTGRSIRAIGRELDARYAVSGDISQRDSRLILDIHLLETVQGGSIWSRSFSLNGAGDSAWAMLVNQIAGHISTETLRADAERALRQEPHQLSADGMVNRASQTLTVLNRRTFHEIEQLARMAIDISPSHPAAYGVLAGAYALRAHQAWTSSPDDDLEEAFSEGSRAVELSPTNPRTLYWWGHVHLFGGRTSDALGILENAVAGDTSHVPAHIALGAASVLGGKVQHGIARLQHALKLGPDHPQAFQAYFWLGIGQLEHGETAMAQQAFSASINRNVLKNPAENGFTFWPWMGLAANLALADRQGDAEAILDNLQDRFPDGDYHVMIDHAAASFAPNLKELKMMTAIEQLLDQAPNLESATSRGASLRDLLRRRTPLES